MAFECLCLLIAGQSSESSVRSRFQTETRKEVLTNTDVVRLSKIGLRDSAIIKKIRCSDTNFDTRLEELKRLKSNGVSDAVIKVMVSSQKNAAASSGEELTSSGIATPRRSEGPAASRPTELTPAQIEAQEKATRRANPPVPVQPGGTQGSAQPGNPEVQPIVNAATESVPGKSASSLATPNHSRKKKRKTPHNREFKTVRRTEGDQS